MTAFLNPSLLTRVKQYVYTAIGEHRGSKRVWLEGNRLAESGFTKGTRVSVHWNPVNCQLTFVKDDNGKKVVSGRVNKKTGVVKPIIDLCSKDLAPAGTRIRATFMKGMVTVTLHHEEQKKWDREMRLMAVASGLRTLKEGSCCTGVGVSTYGVHDALEKANIRSELEWVVDVEQKYLEAAVQNNPAFNENTQLVVAALEEVEPELLSTVDLMSVSLPCLGFSLSGRAKLGLKFGEAHPEAATAVFGLMQLIKRTNPSIVLSENVPLAKDSATYHLLISELERIGFRVQETILDGNDAGTIENRSRYFFVAVSDGVADQFDINDLIPRHRPYQTLGEVKSPVEDDSPMWKTYDYLDAKAIRDKAAGKGFARQFVTAESTSVGCIGKSYNKGRSTEPFWLREDGMQRLLTVEEHASVKLIPSMLVADLAVTTAHESLGQAVLMPHITALMERVVEGVKALDGKHFEPAMLMAA